MNEPKLAPYGSWKSPISSDMIVSGIEFEQIEIDGEEIYWVERRPTESGRSIIVRRSSDGLTKDVTPPSFNVRTRVHEYGGGAFVVSDGAVYFSNFADQRIYRQDLCGRPRPITPKADLRYADGIVDHRLNRIICVCEDHMGNEVVNTLVTLDRNGGDEGRVIVSGNDFYSSPSLSPDGSYLSWLTWNYPNMPWDGTELWLGELNADGSLGTTGLVAGGTDESVFQPEWSPDGHLYFVSDRTGWWNLYRWCNDRAEPLLEIEMDAEFGVPQWGFGMHTYAFESPDRILCTYTVRGRWYLASLDTATHNFKPIEIAYTDIKFLRASSGRGVFIAGSPIKESSIVEIDLNTNKVEVLRRSNKRDRDIDIGYLSIPKAIEIPTEQGLTAHAFYYAPKNPDYIAPKGERPPLLVKSHGGPTSATSSILDLSTQYWTSRGIAVLDVNYRGSTGYGRAYRERLEGYWGVVDVDDCLNGARYLVERGEVDRDRLAIT